MVVNIEKGWMSVPGIRERADRTIQEQMAGLEQALTEAKGKTVLDLGCAEGAIGLEFAKAGAVDVLGIESLESHLQVARKYCAGWPAMRFQQAYLQEWIPAHEPPEVFDIVLCLGIAHKLAEPASCLRFACRSARSLVCFRSPAAAWDGWFQGKHSGVRCHAPTEFAQEGFAMERKVTGAHREAVEYWRRK